MDFKKITFDNFEQCKDLSAGPDSGKFVAPNTISLAQAYIAKDNDNCTPMPYGIYVDDVMVGFIMMAYVTTEQDDSLESNAYEVWRFMIDETYQDKGYGKEALIKAIDHMKTEPCGSAKACFLSYVPGNEKAEALYLKVGFKSTGIVDDGEIQMKLDL